MRRICAALLGLLLLAGCSGTPGRSQARLPGQPEGLTTPARLERPARPAPGPRPTGVTFPARPQTLADYPAAIASFLNQAPRNIFHLKGLLLDWEAIDSASPIFAGDVRGVGELDLLAPIYRVGDRPGPNDKLGAILRVYPADEGPWQAELAARPETDVGLIDIQLHYVGDLTGDGQDDLLWSSATFGANTGFQRVQALTLDVGAWREIFAEDQTWGDVMVDPTGPWGWPGIILNPGFAGSAGAGPQREVTRFYRWEDGDFILFRQELGSNRYLPLRFVDAEWHLLGDRPDEAAALYIEALTDESLRVWPAETAEGELRRFYRTLAAFRLMAMAGKRGDAAGVEAMAARAAALGGDPLLPAVQAFAAEYSRSRDYKAACRAAHARWPGPVEPSKPPYYWGFMNPVFTGAVLCPDLYGYTLAKGTPEVARVTVIE